MQKQQHPLFPAYTRLWVRFSVLKCIYPMERNQRKNKPKWKITMEDIDRENPNGQRWVEIPDDYTGKVMNELVPEDGENRHILELVVQRIGNTERWMREWRLCLKTGDIIDVRDDQEKWYESVVRLVEYDPDSGETFVYVHFIGWNIKWDERINVRSDCIAKRGTHTNGPHRPRTKKIPSAFR